MSIRRAMHLNQTPAGKGTGGLVHSGKIPLEFPELCCNYSILASRPSHPMSLAQSSQSPQSSLVAFQQCTSLPVFRPHGSFLPHPTFNYVHLFKHFIPPFSIRQASLSFTFHYLHKFLFFHTAACLHHFVVPLSHPFFSISPCNTLPLLILSRPPPPNQALLCLSLLPSFFL